MSVLIRGMDFPKNCDCCKFQRRSYDTFVKFCQFHVDNIVNDIDKIIKQREPNCPLVEVSTPHERLIDTKKLLEAIKDLPYGYRGIIKDLIYNQPTVIEREE